MQLGNSYNLLINNFIKFNNDNNNIIILFRILHNNIIGWYLKLNNNFQVKTIKIFENSSFVIINNYVKNSRYGIYNIRYLTIVT